MRDRQVLRLRGHRVDRVERQPYEPPQQPAWYFDERRACSPDKGRSPLWTSDMLKDRNEAVRRCKTRCPFAAECLTRAVDHGEREHVWGGWDFTTKGKPSISDINRTDPSEFDKRVKALYSKGPGLNDTVIAEILGVAASTVWLSRQRQELPALYGSSGKRLEQVPA
jgi:hypothetical protein